MSNLDPRIPFELIKAHMPAGLVPNLLIVGSLAAAYHHRDKLERQAVNTKDADLIVHPAGAKAQAAKIVHRLLAHGFEPLPECVPRARADSEDLQAIRLYPPGSTAYFVELLGFPSTAQTAAKIFDPFEVNGGWYALPTFRYMGLTEFGQRTSENGLKYAAPEMMALSNLLAHPTVGPDLITKPIEGRQILRASKDLGRVLALGWLAGPREMEEWPERWTQGLREKFPTECFALAARAGDGLRKLIENPTALDDADFAVNVGLLNNKGVGRPELTALAAQLQELALQPLADAFSVNRFQ